MWLFDRRRRRPRATGRGCLISIALLVALFAIAWCGASSVVDRERATEEPKPRRR